MYLKLNKFVMGCGKVKNNYSEWKSVSSSQRIYLPSLIVCKRIVFAIAFIVLSYMLISWKRDEDAKSYNKWKLEGRYVGELYTQIEMKNQRKRTNDYMFSFLAKIISDKKAISHICDELDIPSCTTNSRYG